MSKKLVHTNGKRKRAIAKATLKQGKSFVKINNISLDIYEPEMLRLKMREPLILAGKKADNLGISVVVKGGGITGQANAARLAIAKAMIEHDASLKPLFLDYDRQLLVADVRRKEARKPNSHGKARAKRQKSYR